MIIACTPKPICVRPFAPHRARLDAGRHIPLFAQRSTGTSLYGNLTFSNFTVLPEIALARVNKAAPFDKICYIGCGVTTGIGAVINTAKAETGCTAIVFGLAGSAECDSGTSPYWSSPDCWG